MRPPKVSYVVPVYNGQRFLAETIHSVLEQTHRNLELIVVDDGSTDESCRVVQTIEDPRLILVQQPNLGVSFARNRGVTVASGRYVGFVDQDDLLERTKTARQLQAMEQNDWSFCFSWASFIDGDGRPCSHPLEAIVNEPHRDQVEVVRRLARGNYFMAPSHLARRSCYGLAAWPVGLFAMQDYALWLQLWSRLRGGVVEERLVRYRIHDRNVSLHDWSQEYKLFEAAVCVILASLAAADRPPTPRCSPERAAHERRTAAWLLAGGFPGVRALAHAHVLRAINLDPGEAEGYALAAQAMRAFGYDQAADRFQRMAANVRPELGYRLPLVGGWWNRNRWRRGSSLASLLAESGAPAAVSRPH